MRTWWLLAMQILWGMSPAWAVPSKHQGEVYSDYEKEVADLVYWPLSADEEKSWGQLNIRVQQAKIILDDRLQTEEMRYLASANYLNFLIDFSDIDNANYYCKRYPPKADHFEYRGECLRISRQPIEVIAKAMEELGEEAARALPNRLSASKVYKDLGTMLNSKGYIHAALAAYQKALRVTPPEYEDAIIQSKYDLAVIYANPLLSKDLQRIALEYYGEIRDFYARFHPKPGSYEYIHGNAVIYNRGVTYLLNFQDYAAAIREFEQVRDFEYVAVDAAVFKAYAQAKSQQTDAARATLKAIDWGKSLDPVRTEFLKCYVEITERLLGDGKVLTACTRLENPQIDVFLDLTSTLAAMKLSMQEENTNLRRFYRYFMEHLKPDVQESLGSAITSADLEREKAESRMKSLQLKNMSLYQNLSYALLGFALVCAVALFIAIRFWIVSRRHAKQMSEGRAQLQSIIDSVEEGLIRIGMHRELLPQVSPHLLRITRGDDLRGKTLQDLLQLTDLDADSIATALQSVDASLGEDIMAWDLNLHNLPIDVKIGEREIALYWQAETKADIVQSLLLVLRDVTEINDLHRKSAHAQDKADRVLVYAREISACNPRTIRAFIGELPQRMTQFLALAAQDNVGDLKKLAHLMKGNARSLGLLALQNAMHAFEDQMKGEDPSAWKVAIAGIQDIMQAYQTASEHVLGQVGEQSAQTLFDLIAMLKPGLEKQLQQAHIRLGGFGVQEGFPVSAAEMEPLKEVILHGLTNAADHGFILPKQQGRAVPPVASFQIEITCEAERKILTLRDNGAGIHHAKIRELAAKRGWQPLEGQIWSDFLFQDGVSTAENLSVTSGRGVGLAAIYSASRQLGGEVKLLDNDRETGSMIRLVWPIEGVIAA